MKNLAVDSMRKGSGIDKMEEQIVDLRQQNEDLRKALLGLIPSHRNPKEFCWCPVSIHTDTGHLPTCIAARDAMRLASAMMDLQKKQMPTGYPFTLYCPSRQAYAEIRVSADGQTYALYWRSDHGFATRFDSDDSADYWLNKIVRAVYELEPA